MHTKATCTLYVPELVTDMSIDEEIRLKLFADAQILDSLCTSAAWQSLNEVRDYLNPKSERGKAYHGLINGYKWVVATALYSILDEFIRNPDLWGLDPDERLQDWWSFYQSGSGVPLQSAVTDRDSHLGSIVLFMDSILDMLRSANSWEGNRQALAKAKEFGDVFLEATHQCVVTATDGREDPPAMKEVLRKRGLERLLDYLEYEMKSVYPFVWLRKESLDPAGDDDFWLDPSRGIETHLNLLPTFLGRHTPGENWGIGSIAAICILIQALDAAREGTFDICSKFARFSTDYSAMQEEVRERLRGTYPSERFGLKSGEHLPIGKLVEMSKAVDPEILTGKDKLAARMGNETRLIASNDFRGGGKFRIVVAGIASILRYGEKVEIIQMTHPRDNDNTSDVSLAVRVEKVNAFANTSMWWVFYRAYTVGRIFEPDQKRLYREIKDTFAEFAEFIEASDFVDVSKQDLLDLCEPPVWRYVFNSARNLLDENAELRGALPEVLTAIMLTYTGYQHIKTSFKDSALFKRLALQDVELDVIGIKPTPEGNVCVIAETKGKATTDVDLSNEIKKFDSVLRFLREQRPELAKALDFNGEIDSVKGYFISMGDIEKFRSQEEGMEIWGYTRFVTALKRAGIPRRYTDLLSRVLIAKVVDWSNYPINNAWFEANDGI